MGVSATAVTSMVKSEAGFDAIVEYWAKARIDSPLQVMARFDDAARQLITIGSLIQSAYIAAVGIGNFGATLPHWTVILVFSPFLVMIVCAARVICRVPLNLDAMQTYMLLKQMRSGVQESDLDSRMDEWCRNVDTLARSKHRWLFGANAAFFIWTIVFGIIGWFVMSR